MPNLPDTTYPIHDLLARRWSPRAFAARPVSTETLASLFEAARWTPSSANQQPWHFIVATQADPADYRRMFDCLKPNNQRWAGTAPVLMIAVARLAGREDRPNRYAWYDTGQAVAQLTVEATAHGLYIHQMGGFSHDRARETYDIPAGYEPVVALAIGYLGDVNDLPEELQAREQSRRGRRPVSNFVFTGRWGEPLRL